MRFATARVAPTRLRSPRRGESHARSGGIFGLAAMGLACAGLTAGAAEAVAQAAAADPNAEPVPAITPAQIHALVDEHRGDIVVVNFWATWCPPCLAEFPDIIEVYEAYRGRGVEVFAVSMNEADEAEDIAAFLDRFEPPFPIYRASSVDEEFYAGVVEPWFGEMPITLIFDANGEQAHFHRRAVDYSGLSADIESLLGEPPADR